MTPHQQALVARLESSLGDLFKAVILASDKPQPENEWPISTIMIHLAIVEEVIWQARLKQMAVQDNPHRVWTEPDVNGAVAQYGELSLPELEEWFGKQRFHTLRHLSGLDEAGWNRVGTHATYGEMDVAGLCARILEHDNEHLEELRKRAT